MRTFSGFEDEGDALPSWIVDPKGGRGEGGTDGVAGHGIVIKVTGFAVSRDVLPEEGIAALNRWDGTQDFDLSCCKNEGRLQRT